MKRKPPRPPESVVLSYCEPVVGNASNTWHLRRLSADGRKLGGGVDSPSLCGRVEEGRGWDIDVPVLWPEALANSERRYDWGSLMVCPQCVALVPEHLRTD